ncbi:hypothetical protein FACS1894111_05940 [Clostridia bacterium]|nr:hypothetical protein FACS1894111_05940 [Clostridia bacterium]
MDISENGIVPTLRAQTHGHPPITFAVYPIRDPQLNQNANGFIISPEGEPSPTLSATDRHAVAFFEAYQHHGYRYAEKTGPPTSGQNSHIRGDTPIIQKCYTPSSHGNYAEGIGTLRANGGDYGGGSETLIVVFKKLAFYVKYSLRKLTPLECERLQGFPDNWTKYNTKGEQIADTPRYVALGNSLAVPCAERVFRGIVAVMRGGL